MGQAILFAVQKVLAHFLPMVASRGENQINNLNQLTKLAYKNGFAEIIRELTEIKLYLDIVIHKIQKP